MSEIVTYGKGYTTKVSGGDHDYARIIIYANPSGYPSISTQKADGLIRKENSKLRLVDKARGDSFLGGTDYWIRYYSTTF